MTPLMVKAIKAIEQEYSCCFMANGKNKRIDEFRVSVVNSLLVWKEEGVSRQIVLAEFDFGGAIKITILAGRSELVAELEYSEEGLKVTRTQQPYFAQLLLNVKQR